MASSPPFFITLFSPVTGLFRERPMQRLDAVN